jgi:hypothetical protein
VLQRAMDVTKLLLPYEPTEFVSGLAAHKTANPAFGIEQVHFSIAASHQCGLILKTAARLACPCANRLAFKNDLYRH